MELGQHAEKCDCQHVCRKGVEPMADCVCRLPGETIAEYCDICDPSHKKFTWHNNGSCITCIRRAFQEKKDRMAKRHAEVLVAPPNPVQIEDADYTPVETPKGTIDLVSAPTTLELILRVNGIDLKLTDDVAKVQRILQVL